MMRKFGALAERTPQNVLLAHFEEIRIANEETMRHVLAFARGALVHECEQSSGDHQTGDGRPKRVRRDGGTRK